jgi:ABC-type sugar transport system ATPase subunit
VSSDLKELMTVCDRIAVMSNGSLAEFLIWITGARIKLCRQH